MYVLQCRQYLFHFRSLPIFRIREKRNLYQEKHTPKKININQNNTKRRNKTENLMNKNRMEKLKDESRELDGQTNG